MKRTTTGNLYMRVLMAGHTNTHKQRGCFVVKNDKGLHTRPSTELVRRASQFQSRVLLKHQNTTVNAKSLLGILSMAATKGTKIEVEATGADAEKAVNALLELADNQFYICY